MKKESNHGSFLGGSESPGPPSVFLKSLLVFSCESVFLAEQKNPSYLLLFAPSVLKETKGKQKTGRFFFEIDLKFSEEKSLTAQ